MQNSPPEVLFVKSALEICSKITGEHSCQSTISIELIATLSKLHFDMGFLCKFPEYFENTFSQEHLCRTASEYVTNVVNPF